MVSAPAPLITPEILINCPAGDPPVPSVVVPAGRGKVPVKIVPGAPVTGAPPGIFKLKPAAVKVKLLAMVTVEAPLRALI
jgi:hypothetical protein